MIRTNVPDHQTLQEHAGMEWEDCSHELSVQSHGRGARLVSVPLIGTYTCSDCSMEHWSALTTPISLNLN